MTTQISKSEQDERGLLPYPVIIAATKGDPEAMNIVVQHYESYIASLSMRKLRDERGNIYLYWSSFLVTLCSEIMLYIETPLVSYSYSLNEVSHSCTS